MSREMLTETCEISQRERCLPRRLNEINQFVPFYRKKREKSTEEYAISGIDIPAGPVVK
jgi:hypothetical protein